MISTPKEVFDSVLDRFCLVRRRGHTFFRDLLPDHAGVCDAGSHRAEFLSELEDAGFTFTAVAIEANPALAASIGERNLSYCVIKNAALVAVGMPREVTLSISTNPEASSIYDEVADSFGKMSEVVVPCLSLSEVLRHLPEGRADLVKMDIEGAEIDVLLSSDAKLLSCVTQLSVEFHDNFFPAMRPKVREVERHLLRAGFLKLNANWPYTDDVLFVNRGAAKGGFGLRLRILIANGLYRVRGGIFCSLRWARGEKLES